MYECWEEARQAGWADAWWTQESKQIATHTDCELVSNVFGNMFSAFNYLPFYCSLISTIGKYHKKVACKQKAPSEAALSVPNSP